jgi:diaminopimelate epimerase
MTIPFLKLHGAKNDFLLTPLKDAPAGAGTEQLSAMAIAICNRNTGVGADGWMLLDAGFSSEYDAAIRLFNSDGSEPELSGNGTRCAAAVLARNMPGKTEFRIRTGGGLKHLRLVSHSGAQWIFDMNMGQIIVRDPNTEVQGRRAVIVDAGNPQCVFPVSDFDFDWRSFGASVERDARFPNRTNVSFVRSVDPHAIDVRFWERGAGETNSSGTGSTGAAVAAMALGIARSPVTVLTPAGRLDLRTEGEYTFLTGPAEWIAEGVYYYGANADL